MPHRTASPTLPRRRMLAGLPAAAVTGALAACLVATLAACAAAVPGTPGAAGPAATGDAGAGEASVIEGTVTYRERIALSPGALLEIALFDVTEGDPGARPIAKQLYADIGQVPLRFAFAFDPRTIAPERSYALVARILEGERPVFLTTEHAEVLTDGAGAEPSLVLARAPGGRGT